MSDDLHVVPGMEDEPTFAEPWQAQIFALTVALHRKGVLQWNEWAATLSGELAVETDYWTAWMRALEKTIARTGLVDAGVMAERTEAWREAANATPHGEPIVLPPMD